MVTPWPGAPAADAAQLGGLLVETDLRGVSSHGTVLMGPPQEYVRHMLSGDVNPCPEVTVVTETQTTRLFDGDGVRRTLQIVDYMYSSPAAGHTPGAQLTECTYLTYASSRHLVLLGVARPLDRYR
jgi:hypothetical protein